MTTTYGIVSIATALGTILISFLPIKYQGSNMLLISLKRNIFFTNSFAFLLSDMKNPNYA